MHPYYVMFGASIMIYMQEASEPNRVSVNQTGSNRNRPNRMPHGTVGTGTGRTVGTVRTGLWGIHWDQKHSILGWKTPKNILRPPMGVVFREEFDGANERS